MSARTEVIHEIGPRPSPGLRFGELWAARELFWHLTKRDIRLRYAQAALGVLWAGAQPISMAIVLALIVGRVDAFASRDPYILVALCGLVPWTFFSQALNSASSSLVSSADLISKVYFPRLLLPMASATAHLVDFGLGLIVLLGAMLLRGISPLRLLACLPLLVAAALVAALAPALWLSAITVRYRDVKHAIPVAIQLLLIASPVVYPSTVVPERWRWLLGLSPVAGLIEAFRGVALEHSSVSWSLIAVSAAVAISVFVTGLMFFRRVESSFADVI